MNHTLHVDATTLAKYPAKGGIITKHDPLIEAGDVVLLTCDRNQVAMRVIEVEPLHSRSMILWLAVPGTMLRAAGGIPPDVPTLERQDELTMFGKTAEPLID